MGESTFLLWLNFKSNTTTSCPHFFSFFTVVFLLSLSLFILSFFFFFFAPSPSSFKSLGSLWYHSMRQQSFGDILSCCMAVQLLSVAKRMSSSPAVYYKQQARKMQRSGEQREKDGTCCVYTIKLENMYKDKSVPACSPHTKRWREQRHEG